MFLPLHFFHCIGWSGGRLAGRSVGFLADLPEFDGVWLDWECGLDGHSGVKNCCSKEMKSYSFFSNFSFTYLTNRVIFL